MAARDWAASIPISQVYFVGSRVNGTARAETDLDTAITLRSPFGYGDWIFLHDAWQNDLQSRIDCPVHLLRGGGTLPNTVVEIAIREHGLLVDQRHGS